MEKNYPETVYKLNWGAFLLTPFWALFHRMWLIGILSLIPVLSIVISVISLFNGSQWAWDKKEWESELAFEEDRSKWNLAGIIVLILCLLIGFLFF